MDIKAHCLQAQVSGGKFGHQARDNRFSSLMALLMEKDISESFPSLFGDQYALKNFYRFVNNPSVTHQSIMVGSPKRRLQARTHGLFP